MDTCRKIVFYFTISFMINNCAQGKRENVNQNQLNTPNMTNYIELEKEKIAHLMNSFSQPLKEITAKPSASEMSALYAIGYEVTDKDVFCVIYIYENQQQHEAAREFLRKNQIAQSENSITSSNGGLFFLGYQKTNNSMSKYILNDLAAAFSGEE